MTVVKPSSESSPRHPCHEIAALLATALFRLRAGQAVKESAVRLDSSCNQSVHANPTQQEGVCQ